MAEAIITRTSGEVETPIPITPEYHSILVTLLADNGIKLTNWPISCKDGSTWYNYNTNEKAQCLFVCNSGGANIFANNVKNGVRYIDIGNSVKNIDSPVGSATRLNLIMEKPEEAIITNSCFFSVINQRLCDINIVGGGGGGTCGSAHQYPGSSTTIGYGGGGGAGYINNYTNQILLQNNEYNFVAGSGGKGAIGYSSTGNYLDYRYGKTGGTSIISGTQYVAIGGSGGGTNIGGKGGLGNGGDYNQDGENSPVNYAGGGGGGGIYKLDRYIPTNGGTPYGGKGWYWSMTDGKMHGGTDGILGGGGGGSGTGSDDRSSNGGDGLLRIVIHY